MRKRSRIDYLGIYNLHTTPGPDIRVTSEKHENELSFAEKNGEMEMEQWQEDKKGGFRGRNGDVYLARVDTMGSFTISVVISVVSCIVKAMERRCFGSHVLGPGRMVLLWPCLCAP